MHQSFHGKPLQPVIRQSRYLGLVDFQAPGRRALREFLVHKYLINGNGKANFCLLFFGVGQAEISEDISRTLNNGRLIPSLSHVAPCNPHWLP